MPLRIGLLVYPLFVVTALLSRPGAVSKLVKAGATTPDRARKLSSVGIHHRDELDGAIKRRVAIALGDGRYYVDLARYRARRRAGTILMVALGVVGLGLAVLAFPPWS